MSKHDKHNPRAKIKTMNERELLQYLRNNDWKIDRDKGVATLEGHAPINLRKLNKREYSSVQIKEMTTGLSPANKITEQRPAHSYGRRAGKTPSPR